jgi:hypothetical protein
MMRAARRPLAEAGLIAASVVAASLVAALATAATADPSPATPIDAAPAHAAPTHAPSAMPRVEARNAELLAVGVVSGAAMTLHLSRLADNAPVRDAAVSVALRGAEHPARAQPDGGYSLESPDLELPGDAAVEIRVNRGGAVSVLKGVLSVERGGAADKSNGRQLWWWALNFAVCLGFLYLWSRRSKSAPQPD